MTIEQTTAAPSPTPARTAVCCTKHEGLGNDFLVAVDPPRPIGALDARCWCDRRRGIGADGLIALTDLDAPEGPRMVLFNADGSRAEISGNGIRCAAQALARHLGSEDRPGVFTMRTDAGLRRLEYRPTDEPRIAEVSVDMGVAADGPAAFGGWLDLGVDVRRQIGLDLGNPHLVALVDDPAAHDITRVGPAVEAGYPQGLNVHLVRAVGSSQLELRVWERGVGATEACGSGASAAATAAVRWGLVTSPVTVEMPGGAVTVETDGHGPVMLTGPARWVATVCFPGEPSSGEVDHG